MLKKDSFSKGYGLITDYIAAVLHELRNYDWTDKLKEYALFDGSLSERDHLAIRKTFSGMMKLLYPDGAITNEEAYELVDFAAESRKRVKDQLYKIDETFKAEPAVFKYIRLKDGEEICVETLEQVSNVVIVPQNASAALKAELNIEENEIPQEATLADDESSGNKSHRKRERIQTQREGAVSFRLGQTGVTFEKLFLPYLSKSKEITIEDPFVRTSWQLRNLIEFLTMLVDNRPDEDFKVRLVTWEEDEKLPVLIDRLDDIKDDMATYGIDFDYSFREFHDRQITTDDGWNISLGRGLDIYDKYNAYSIASGRQERRKCREFRVIYMKSDNMTEHGKIE